MGLHGSRKGATAFPSPACKDTLFCPPQDALFGLQQCQWLLTPRAALLAQLSSLWPWDAWVRCPAINPSHPG